MKSSRIILIASEHGLELQDIIQAAPQSQVWTIDRLDDQADLAARLSDKLYNLAIIDVDRFANILLQRPNILPSHTALLLLVTVEERRQALKYLQQTTGDYLLFPIDAVDLIFRVKQLLNIQHLQQYTIQPDSGVQALLKLNDVTQEMMQTLELEEALNILLIQACQLTNANVARLFLSDSEGNLSREVPFIKSSMAEDNFEKDDTIFRLAQQSALSQQIQLYIQALPALSLNTILTAPLISRA